MKEMSLNVQVYDSTDRRTVVKLDVSPDVANIVICGETRPFRFLARHIEFKEAPEKSYALDLGCSTGETTCILFKRFKSVLGLDVSEEIVTKGMRDHPELDLRVVDVLANREELHRVIEQEFEGNVPVIFVDIGGDRMQDTVILFLSYLLETFGTPTIIVKSRKLFRHLVKNCLEDDGVHCKSDAWETLIAETRKKELKDRKCFHPQRYHLHLTPDPGNPIPICRYHNYSECKKGDACEQDHTYCHHCLQLGHRGSECPAWANEIIVRKKKT